MFIANATTTRILLLHVFILISGSDHPIQFFRSMYCNYLMMKNMVSIGMNGEGSANARTEWKQKFPLKILIKWMYQNICQITTLKTSFKYQNGSLIYLYGHFLLINKIIYQMKLIIVSNSYFNSKDSCLKVS